MVREVRRVQVLGVLEVLGVLTAFALLTAGCEPSKPVLPPTANLQPRLDAADTLVRVGCFDCLTGAFAEYDAIRAVPHLAPVAVDAATTGAIRTALLVDLRERELGMSDDGYLERAKTLASSRDDINTPFAPAIDMVSTIAWRGAFDDKQAAAMMRQTRNRDAWYALFRSHAGESPFDAYLWLTIACATGESARLLQTAPAELTAPFEAFKTTTLIDYKMATCVGPRRPGGPPTAMTADAIVDLSKREPRFEELNYLLGIQAITRADLDGADAALRHAYAWHPAWPAATIALANVSLTAEDFDGALAFYEKTLALSPAHHDAELGRLRALSYLNRHDEAIAAATAIIDGHWNRGDALYWRAWNEMQLERFDPAWTDIEDAWKVWIHADVAKLAGIIAYRRHEPEVSRAKFETSRTMNSMDCETGFYLGLVDAELRLWQPTVDVFLSTAECLEKSRKNLAEEIAKIRASKDPEDRKAKKIARRERQLTIETRRLATSWFDTAVGYFNLSQKPEARQYAEKVSDDEQFGERARELLSRLEK